MLNTTSVGAAVVVEGRPPPEPVADLALFTAVPTDGLAHRERGTMSAVGADGIHLGRSVGSRPACADIPGAPVW